MKKKLLSATIVVLVSVLNFTPSIIANLDKYETMDEIVLYYNDFPIGTNADLPEVEHEQYYFYGRNTNLKYALNEGMEYIHNSDTTMTHTYNVELDDLISSNFNGDIGCRVRSFRSLGSGSVVLLVFRYKDADKTPTDAGTLA